MKRLAVILLLLALAVAMCGCRIYIAPGLALRIEFETAGQEAAAPNEDAGDEAQPTRAPGTNGTSSSGATRTPDATAAPSPTPAQQTVPERVEPSREQDVFEGEIYDIP